MESRLTTTVELEQEVKQKFDQHSALSFQILTEQLDRQYDSFLKLFLAAKALQSDSCYYSTAVLQNKLKEGLNTVFKLQAPDSDDPLVYLQEKEKKQYEKLLQGIQKTVKNFKDRIHAELTYDKEMKHTINHLMPQDSKKQIDSFKHDVYLALQKSAEEYRIYLIKKGLFGREDKMREFLDIFGCVITLDFKVPPYQLVKDRGYGIPFGLEARLKNKLPPIVPQRESLKEYKLSEIEALLNQVIGECQNVKEDSGEVLEIIRKNFEALKSQKNLSEYFQINTEVKSDFLPKSMEGLAKFLPVKASVLLKSFVVNSEEVITKAHINASKIRHEQYIKDRDVELLKDMERAVKLMQDVINKGCRSTLQTKRLIKQEISVSTNLLAGPAEEFYKKIMQTIHHMRALNDELEKQGIVLKGILNRLNTVYHHAIAKAKQNDRKQFEAAQKTAKSISLEAEVPIGIVDESLRKQKINSTIVADELVFAKKTYDGKFHKTPEAEFKVQNANAERLKASCPDIQKEYNAIQLKPKALEDFEKVVFNSISINEEVEAINLLNRQVPLMIQKLWALYYNALQGSLDHKVNNIVDVKSEMEVELLRLSEVSSRTDAKVLLINKFKAQAKESFDKVAGSFPADVSQDFQSLMEESILHFEDALKQVEKGKELMASVVNMSGALMVYKEHITAFAEIYDVIVKMNEAAIVVKRSTLELKNVYDEACEYGKQGVVKVSLNAAASSQFAKAKESLAFLTGQLGSMSVRVKEEGTKLSKTQEQFSSELHAKPKEMFDELRMMLAEIDVTTQAAELAYRAAENLPRLLQVKLHEAKVIGQEKASVTQLKQLLLKSILHNLSIFNIGKWGGGIDYRFDGQVHRIPHGVLDLINAISKSNDYKSWIPKIVALSKQRNDLSQTQWKYKLFSIRNERTTGALYRAIYQSLAPLAQKAVSPEDSGSLIEQACGNLQAELQKIPGLKMDVPTPAILTLSRK